MRSDYLYVQNGYIDLNTGKFYNDDELNILKKHGFKYNTLNAEYDTYYSNYESVLNFFSYEDDYKEEFTLIKPLFPMNEYNHKMYYIYYNEDYLINNEEQIIYNTKENDINICKFMIKNYIENIKQLYESYINYIEYKNDEDLKNVNMKDKKILILNCYNNKNFNINLLFDILENNKKYNFSIIFYGNIEYNFYNQLPKFIVDNYITNINIYDSVMFDTFDLQYIIKCDKFNDDCYEHYDPDKLLYYIIHCIRKFYFNYDDSNNTDNKNEE